MHHAAHMSVGKTVAALVLMWSWAGALAALPLLGMGSYEFRHRRYHCFFSWHKVYVGLVVTLCFVLPGLVLMAMYFGIFRVARQAATQVGGGSCGMCVCVCVCVCESVCVCVCV